MAFGAVLLAAFVHECGHLCAMHLFHVPIEHISLGIFGAEITSSCFRRLSYGKDILITVAGPLSNLLLAFLFAALTHFTQSELCAVFSGAQTVTAAFNLLPIQPLDGGRTLYSGIALCFDPIIADAVLSILGKVAALIVLIFSVFLYVRSHTGLFFILAGIGLAFFQFPQLNLAQSGKRV